MIDRFMKRVLPEPNSGCWLWDGSVFWSGYGQFAVGRKNRLAHRVSYELHCGPVPEGAMVLHSCDVRCCVNPAHLRTGTRSDNAHDMYRRGRGNRTYLHGESNASSKLTEDQVTAIRASAEPQYVLAARFGISQSNVSYIKRGLRWGELWQRAKPLTRNPQ